MNILVVSAALLTAALGPPSMPPASAAASTEASAPASTAAPTEAPAPAQAHLDALMRDVLRQRDAASRALTGLRFRESEQMTVRGQEEVAPLQSSTKEFSWRGRDGLLERDPLSVNGVPIDGEAVVWDADAEGTFSLGRLYQWDSLFHFPFEPGRYLPAGREYLEGRQVLRVEYYPSRWVGGDDDEHTLGEDFDRTSLVTLWVLVEERRLVAWRYDSIGLQFLPLRWLARMDSLHAEMIIDAAADGTWLPRRFTLSVRASMAPAQITVELVRTFHDYTRDDGSPLQPAPDAVEPGDIAGLSAVPGEALLDGGAGQATTPAQVGEAAAVGAVAFHGNYSLPDGQLGGIARVSPGDPFSADVPEGVRRRLLDTGLVDRAQVRVRPADLDLADEVTLMTVVRQRPGRGDHVQVLPLFEWSDEYGVTVGGRLSLVQLYGRDDRLSFPLAFGGRDLVAAEFTDDFTGHFISGVRADGGHLKEANPHFGADERRVRARARAFKRFAWAQIDVEGGWADVEFLGVKQQQASWGLAGRIDTRRETGLPRDAVYAAAAWRPLKIIDGDFYNRLELDMRAYVGLGARSTVVVGVKYDGADGQLPSYEKPLLGGLATLRGFEPGEFIGDNRAIASLELRTPVWNPLPMLVVGVNGFWDTGTVWDHADSLRKARFHNGVGGGAFLLAGFLRLNVDVGYGIGEGWQFHIGSGLRY